MEAQVSSFSAALAASLDVLSSVTVGEVDASNVTTGIDAAVAAADTTPTIDADAAAVTADIDAAVAAADTTVPANVDAAPITAEIDAAVAAANAVPEVHVDGGDIAAQIDQAVASTDAEINVTANTGEAEASITSLGDAASGAEGGVEGLSSGMEGLSSIAEAGSGQVSSLGTAAVGLGGGAGKAALGLTALATFTADVFDKASQADVAERRFTAALGESADAVRKVNLGGLNEDLGTLATRTGNSQTALLGASAGIASLGNSAGASAPQIASTTQGVDVLAIRLTTLNPALGEAGDVATGLAAAFNRGGRSLVPYGIALSKAEIEQRALTDTGKASATELTAFDRVAAGTAITVERLGSKLGTDINAGAQKASVQVRSLKAEFELALESFGRPLLDPVIASLRAGEPALVAIGRLLSELAVAVLPLVVKGFEAVVPVVGGVAAGVGVLLDVFGPVLNLLAAIPTPLLSTVAAFVGLRAALGTDLAAKAGLLAISLGEQGIAASARSAGQAVLGMLTPMNLAVAGIGLLITAFVQHSASIKADKAAVDAAATSYGDLTRAVQDITAANVQAGFKGQEDALRRLGLGYADVARFTTQGTAGQRTFFDAMVRGGEISRSTADRILAAGGAVDSATRSFNLTDVITKLLADDNLDLAKAFIEVQKHEEAGAQTRLANLVNTGQLSAATLQAAVAQHKLKDGGTDWLGVLAQLQGPQAGQAQGNRDGASAAIQHATAERDLNDALNDQLNIELASIDKNFALERAHLQVAQAAAGLTTAQQNSAAAIRDHGAASTEASAANLQLQSAEQQVEQAALGLASASVAAAESNANLSGKVLDGKAKQELIRDAFLQVAGTLAPGSALRQRLEDLATRVVTMPDKRIQITADTKAAEANITNLIAQLNALGRKIPETLAPINANRHPLDVSLGRMAGGPTFAGQPNIVGENGPEVWVARTDGFVRNRDQVAAILARLDAGHPNATRGGASVNQTVIVNEVAKDPEATAFAVGARLGQLATR